jgi:hypothetical protein
MFRATLVTAAALVLGSQAAFAQSSNDPLQTRVFKNGFWLGGGAAWSTAELDGTSFDDDSFGYNVGAGYQFANYFGVSALWLDLGVFDDQGVDIDVDGYRIGLTAGYPFSGRIAGTASAGYYDFDVDASGSGFSASGDEDGLFLSAGIASEIGRIVIAPQFVWYDTDDADLYSLELNFYWKIEAGN